MKRGNKIYVTDGDNSVYCNSKTEPFVNEYISSNLILALIKELEKRKFNTTEKAGVELFNINSNIINELKQLLK